jgi:hypothetical protein
VSAPQTRPLDRFQAPFGKQVELLEVMHENDVRLLRVRIREGSRFTVMDLDPVTARRWADTMDAWASAYPEAEPGGGPERGPVEP